MSAKNVNGISPRKRPRSTILDYYSAHSDVPAQVAKKKLRTDDYCSAVLLPPPPPPPIDAWDEAHVRLPCSLKNMQKTGLHKWPVICHLINQRITCSHKLEVCHSNSYCMFTSAGSYISNQFKIHKIVGYVVASYIRTRVFWKRSISC